MPPPELLTLKEIALRVGKRYDTVLKVVRRANLPPDQHARSCKNGLQGGRYDATKVVALLTAPASPTPPPAETPRPRVGLIAGIPFPALDLEFLARQRAERRRRKEAR